MSNTYFEELLSRYRSKGLLIDTNLFLLYLVGLFDQRKISTFKRTQTYVIEDFVLVYTFVCQFKKIITTPHILTEVSNLSGQLDKRIKPMFFKKFADRIDILEEKYICSKQICRHHSFQQFGLTDSAITDLAQNQYLVLTDDLPLSTYLQNHKIDVINFNHIRTFNWNL